MIYKLKLALVSLVAGLAIWSCSDWLYLEPESGIISDEYWKSEQDLKAGTMGIYASMLGNNVSGSYSVPELLLLWGEVRADMLTYFRTQVSDYMLIYNGDLKPTNGFAKWNSVYRTINYCNNILEKAPEILETDASMTKQKMNQYRAEALTIRAMMYLLLNKVYREAPLLLTATTSDNQTIRVAKVENQSELWDQIEADLLEAEGYAAESYGSTLAEDKGRVTKYTVWSIMADFYLWRSLDGDADKAVQACDKIISSGKFSLVRGDDNWLYNLYYVGNSIEGIFELQFAEDILNPYYNLFMTTGSYHANPDVVESFFPVDELADPDSADVRGDRGSYRSSLNYALWKYIGINRIASKSASESYSNFIVYRYADVLLMKAEALSLLVTDDSEASIQKASSSLALIQQVRTRARASKLTDRGTPTTKEGLIDYILEERAREFAFEGKRWFDLLRIAKRDNYALKNYLIDMLQMSAPATRLVSIQAKMQNPDYHYMPIPQSDIDAGYPLLKQNPFYEE
ncbi:MAG: RagB/SusD family nutrient uptake outer membrane protein [Breznakibacter sp.]